MDTVSHNLLGEKKTGLEIERMFEIFKKGDPEEMKEAAEYSIQDSVLLHKLYNIVESDIESLASGFSVTIEQLLLICPCDVVVTNRATLYQTLVLSIH